MNIMIVGMTRSYGGIEKFIVSQLERLPSGENTIFLLNDLNHEPLAYQDKFADLNISDVVSIGISEKVHPYAYVKKVQELCSKLRIDAIVINSSTLRVRHVLQLLAAKISNAKIRIVHSHNSFCDGINAFLNRWLCFLVSGTDITGLITLRLACSAVAGKWEFRKKQFLVINNGIDTKAFSFSVEDRKAVRKALRINETVRVFFHAGRISTQKNSDFLLRVYLKYAASNENTLLLVAGGVDADDCEIGKFNKTLASSPLSSHVIYLGVRADVPLLMSASDVFLLPSLYEGLPIVAIEAQCSGLYCVVSDRISTEVKLTENIDFVPLESDVDKWCEALGRAEKKADRIIRTECALQIKQQGYDIEDSSSKYWKTVLKGGVGN